MSYMIKFLGGFTFNKPVMKELKDFIVGFSNTRRMQRDADEIKEVYPDWKDECFFGDLGPDGEYFIGGDSKQYDPSVMNRNASYPQPSLWCGWTINNQDELVWSGINNFYEYEKWLNYLIDNFFSPLGYVLNGRAMFQGDTSYDKGEVIVVNNSVTVKELQ